MNADEVDPAGLRALADEVILSSHALRRANDALRVLEDRAAGGDPAAAAQLGDMRLAALLDEREFLLAYDRLTGGVPVE